MLKTFSAALIAVSVLAAPAIAGSFGHHQGHPNAFNSNAKMIHHDHHRGLHQHRHVRPHFHFHKKLGMHKTFKHSAIKATAVHKHG